MSAPLYNLVFNGEIVESHSIEDVRATIAEMLRADSATIDRVFSGRPVIIKKGLDYRSAAKYALAFRKAGAICILESVRQDSVTQAPPQSEKTGKEYAGDDQQTVTCPKCGHVQLPACDCIRCGIIFDRRRGQEEEESRGLKSSNSIFYYDVAERKKQTALLVFLLILLAFTIYKFWIGNEIKHPPGILINSEPTQINISSPKPWQVGKRLVVPLAQFSLAARVLSKENYRIDAVADLSPIDLALGWGPMSDQGVLDKLSIAQASRRYGIFPKDGLTVPMAVLLACSSNMHMIPANGEIEDILNSVRTGELIKLSGYLVGVQEEGRWIWFSSLSRTDSGDGACEIIWVEHAFIRKGPESM